MSAILQGLKKARFENYFSQSDMANLLGIHKSTYCDKENGYTPFTLWEIEKILDIFQKTFEEIFQEKNWRNNPYNQ